MSKNHINDWLNKLDWSAVGPQFLTALEDVDFALHSAEHPASEARKIIERVWMETGRTAAEREELGPDDFKEIRI